MVTAGPTREAIDPVRFISNRSSGKMGFAVAEAAAAAGAHVILVSGPVSLDTPKGIRERVDVESAQQMYHAVHQRIAEIDVFISAAAVADYRPERPANQKIQKTENHLELRLVRAPDIVTSVAILTDGPFTVGFAAETENLEVNALDKLARKQLDMIAANRVGSTEGFDTDDNALIVFWPGGMRAFSKASKEELAIKLIALVAERCKVQAKVHGVTG
ncbi:MAG: phosphopantothenoylcysteine decarboxylase [Gammaproteobacteria bacterium]